MRRDRIDFRQEWMRRPQLMLPDNVPAPGPKPVVGPPPLPGLPSRQEVYGDPIRPGAIPQKPLPQGSDVLPPPYEPDAGQLSGTVREPTPAEDYELSFQDKPEKGWKEALYMGLQAINKIFNPDDNRPITSLTEDKRQMRIARAKQRYEASEARTTAEQNRRLRDVQIDAAVQKPITEKFKADTARLRADTDLLYKNEVIALGKRKADELKIYRDAIIELKERGADQYDIRLKQLEDAIEEAKRRNIEAERDKDLDREARIRVANITAGSRESVANIGAQSRKDIAQARSADEARKTLAALTAAGATEEEKRAYIKTLSPEIQKNLNY